MVDLSGRTGGGDWLRHKHLPAPYQWLKIKSAWLEEGFKDTGEQVVILFTQSEKKLALNVTNENTMRELYGDNTDAWIGRLVICYRTNVEYEGKTVPAIRLAAADGRGMKQPVDLNGIMVMFDAHQAPRDVVVEVPSFPPPPIPPAVNPRAAAPVFLDSLPKTPPESAPSDYENPNDANDVPF